MWQRLTLQSPGWSKTEIILSASPVSGRVSSPPLWGGEQLVMSVWWWQGWCWHAIMSHYTQFYEYQTWVTGLMANMSQASQSPTHHLLGVDRPTYKYHLRNDKKFCLDEFYCRCVYDVDRRPRHTARQTQTNMPGSPVTGAELFIIEVRTCESVAETD